MKKRDFTSLKTRIYKKVFNKISYNFIKIKCLYNRNSVCFYSYITN